MDEKILIILVFAHELFWPVIEIFQDIKLWKFKKEDIYEENIFGHLWGGNFDF